MKNWLLILFVIAFNSCQLDHDSNEKQFEFLRNLTSNDEDISNFKILDSDKDIIVYYEKENIGELLTPSYLSKIRFIAIRKSNPPISIMDTIVKNSNYYSELFPEKITIKKNNHYDVFYSECKEEENGCKIFVLSI